MILQKPSFSLKSVVLLLVGLGMALPAGASPWFRGHGGYRGGRSYRPGYYGYRGGYRGFYPYPGTWYGALPHTHFSITFGGSPWYCGGGIWYRPMGGRFVVAVPPLGIVLPVLPPDPAIYWYGGVRYYCVNDVYYTAVPGGEGYRVVAPPPRQEESREEAASPDPALDALVLVPKQGQTPEQMQADRRAARSYATRQTGFDPNRSDPSDPGTPRARKAYFRTMKAFLEGRGYSVD